MPDLVVTAAQVSPIFPRFAEIYTFIAAEAITSGQVVYQAADGRVGVADADVAGRQQARGIALCDGGAAQAGQAVNVLVRGHCAGFTLPQAYDAQLFLSNTAGAVGDAAGLVSVPIGRVVAMSNKPTYTKVAYFDFQWGVQRA